MSDPCLPVRRRGASTAVLVAIVVLSVVATACEFTRDPTPAERRTRSSRTPTPTVATRTDHLLITAAGDIACAEQAGPTPSLCRYAQTSDLVVAKDVDAVLMLGDAQYPNGRYRDFLRYYDPTWGRALAKTYPVIGNHEYETPSGEPNGYYAYFGDRWQGPDGNGYYSFDLPPDCQPTDGLCWHVIALNSELCVVGAGCPQDGAPDSPGGRQLRWLSTDLTIHPNERYPCTIAFFHEPLFRGRRVTEEVRPLWELLYSAGADVVLNGHKHRYERWQRMAPNGGKDAELGIREFIVGTGGSDLEPLEGRPPGLEAAQDVSFGVLELGLYADGYTWRWVPAAGQPTGFSDVSAGPTRCA
jgi:alkaline phosphatase